MSFGNTLIFPFPAVQYIPLAITNLARGSITNATSKAHSELLVTGAKIFEWSQILEKDFNLMIPQSFPAGSYPVFTLNLEVDEVKYRGFYVTLVGQKKPGSYQLFTIPARYFYKKDLYFELYDRASGKRLAHQSFFLPGMPK